MRIEYRYIYIYQSVPSGVLFRPPAPAMHTSKPRSAGEAYANIVGAMHGDAPTEADYEKYELMLRNLFGKLDPKTQKRLEDLLERVQGIVNKINSIRSPGIREMLKDMVAQILNAVAKGDLSSAEQLTDTTQTLTDKCAELCDHILNNIHKLRAGISVKGPAGILLRAIADAAELALNAASSLGDLQDIAEMTDRAVSIGKKLEDLKPGSKEYIELMGKLSDILDGLLAMAQADGDHAQNPGGMGQDTNGTAPTMAGRITNGLNQLRQQEPDTLKQGMIDDLQNTLIGALGNGAGLPDQQGLNQQINDILGQAGQGDLEAALRAAKRLAQDMERAKGLHQHLGRRIALLEQQVGRLDGPMRQQADGVLAKLKAINNATNDPRVLGQLDQLIGDALDACGQPMGPSLARSPGYQKLLKIDRELSSLLPESPDSNGPQGTQPFGQDSYGSPGAPRAGGTRPLGPTDGPSDPPAPMSDAAPITACIATIRTFARRASGMSADALNGLADACAAADANTTDPDQRTKLLAALRQIAAGAAKIPDMSPGSPEVDAAIANLRSMLPRGGNGRRPSPAASTNASPARGGSPRGPATKPLVPDYCPVVESVVVPDMPSPGAEPSPGAPSGAGEPSPGAYVPGAK